MNCSAPTNNCHSKPAVSFTEENDYSDALLKFIGDMLMDEDDMENKPSMLHDCLALQATEKSLYDLLNDDNHFDKTSGATSCFVESNWNHHMGDFESPGPNSANEKTADGTGRQEENEWDRCPNNSSNEKKNRHRRYGDFTMQEHMSNNKQLARIVGDTEPLEMYDDVLLCKHSDRLTRTSGEAEHGQARKKSHGNEQSKDGSNRRRPRRKGKKPGIIKEVVDMRSLLIQCAQAVANFHTRTVNDLLLQIRQHASPQGDSTERVAYYFANALEARLAGTGTELYVAANSSRMSVADVLKAYTTFITACPFKRMANMLANKTIVKLATGATTIHIIDFGILYGFQWPCLIQALSERPGGPPKLRITGIDFPQAGFRPAERAADAGRCLANYCERFRVPFEFNAIAENWETIRVEDLKIEKDELLVVNSLCRLHNVLDDTIMVNSPRDAVLNLINNIKPAMFIHGVINGAYNIPFFVTRFKEVLFHFSSMMDMFEATIPPEDENRLLFEGQVFGKNAMNIIACEGMERVERPETYKQWQIRHVRAGFKQLPLDREIVKHVRSKVKMDYHKYFLVDKDGEWMLQGWKGRVIHAISCWQPVHN